MLVSETLNAEQELGQGTSALQMHILMRAISTKCQERAVTESDLDVVPIISS